MCASPTRAVVGLLLVLALSACASAPKKSGGRTVLLDENSASPSSADGGQPARAKRPPVLVTAADDARVGREVARQVAAEIGILDNPTLEAYVNRIARSLLRGAPRRPFDYEFKVVDQEEPNAFALPGGYIFIARGLLVLAGNEDEVANVIGHEIIHAVKRHSAIQQALAREQSALAMSWVKAKTMAAYGRDMEREADEGGQILAAAAGYDPRGMSTFMRKLDQYSRLQTGRIRQASYLDTHPGSRERAAVNAVRASEIRWTRAASLGDVRLAHLAAIDGMAVGQRPEAGIFDGQRFLHPDLDFQILFPGRWRTANSNSAVGAIAPRRAAVVFLSPGGKAGEPRAAAERFVEKSAPQGGAKVLASEAVMVGGLDAWRLEAELQTPGGTVGVLVTFIPYSGAMWQIQGMTQARELAQYRARFVNTARSFSPLTPEQRRAISGKRLRVVEARAGESVEALSQRTDNAWNPGTTAVQNGIHFNHRFRGDERVKIARVEAYRSPQRPERE